MTFYMSAVSWLVDSGLSVMLIFLNTWFCQKAVCFKTYWVTYFENKTVKLETVLLFWYPQSFLFFLNGIFFKKVLELILCSDSLPRIGNWEMCKEENKNNLLFYRPQRTVTAFWYISFHFLSLYTCKHLKSSNILHELCAVPHQHYIKGIF